MSRSYGPPLKSGARSLSTTLHLCVSTSVFFFSLKSVALSLSPNLQSLDLFMNNLVFAKQKGQNYDLAISNLHWALPAKDKKKLC